LIDWLLDLRYRCDKFSSKWWNKSSNCGSASTESWYLNENNGRIWLGMNRSIWWWALISFIQTWLWRGIENSGGHWPSSDKRKMHSQQSPLPSLYSHRYLSPGTQQKYVPKKEQVSILIQSSKNKGRKSSGKLKRITKNPSKKRLIWNCSLNPSFEKSREIKMYRTFLCRFLKIYLINLRSSLIKNSLWNIATNHIKTSIPKNTDLFSRKESGCSQTPYLIVS